MSSTHAEPAHGSNSLRVCSRSGRARLRPSRKPQKNRLGGSLALPKPDPLEQTLIVRPAGSTGSRTGPRWSGGAGSGRTGAGVGAACRRGCGPTGSPPVSPSPTRPDQTPTRCRMNDGGRRGRIAASMIGGVDADRPVEGRLRPLALLNEVNGQADDLRALHLHLPDHELAAQLVGASPLPVELQARRVAAEREALGIDVFADFQEAVARAAEVGDPCRPR